ncbi:MAG: 30S ribosomal protein S14 [Candidatus Dojkabacteria bacterium]|nr:30S ribosomal protein S14 [Candidatus Dojkabacteria bacterium]MDQ7021377.1 30S ribosomal protein S14 [Candidatus Dojkabacteria bacterium]
MASKAAVAKNRKRRKLINQFAEKRAKLIAEGDYEKLLKLPRNSAASRYRNRCEITGRARGYIGRFKMSRIALRDKVRDGKMPGVRKISW